jgi:hypothetical protein
MNIGDFPAADKPQMILFCPCCISAAERKVGSKHGGKKVDRAAAGILTISILVDCTELRFPVQEGARL